MTRRSHHLSASKDRCYRLPSPCCTAAPESNTTASAERRVTLRSSVRPAWCSMKCLRDGSWQRGGPATDQETGGPGAEAGEKLRRGRGRGRGRGRRISVPPRRRHDSHAARAAVSCGLGRAGSLVAAALVSTCRPRSESSQGFWKKNVRWAVVAVD